MSVNTSDYNKPFNNIFELLPNVFRSDVSKSLMENAFNRFLTKTEMQSVVGVIGDDNSNSRITEIDQHRQANQLQPLIYNKIATVDHISSFKDIMRESARLGIDVAKFDEWGDATQFNFAPPIDFDKIVNYRDYYWVGDKAPQYITIKNRTRKVYTIIQQAYKDNAGLEELANQFLAEQDDTVKDSLREDMDNIASNIAAMVEEYDYIQKTNPYNQVSSYGWDAIDWDEMYDSDWGNPFEGLDIVGVTQSSFEIYGDYTKLFNIHPLFEFYVSESAKNKGIHQVALCTYDEETNLTSVYVTNGLNSNVIDGRIVVSLFDLEGFDPLIVGEYDAKDGTDEQIVIPNPSGFRLQDDPWSKENFWVHITDVPPEVNLSLVNQAQQPIIEYDEFIELNNWSYTKHNWLYNDGTGFVAVDAEPAEWEIFANKEAAFSVFDVNVVESEIVIDVSLHPQAQEDLTIGKDISVELLSGSEFKYFQIENIQLNGNELTISVDQLIPSEWTANDLRVHSIRKSSLGDDWRGFMYHWVYSNADAPIPSPRQELNDAINPDHPDYLSDSEIIEATGTSTVWYRLNELTFRPFNQELRVYVNGIRQYGNYIEGYWDGEKYTTNTPANSSTNAIKFVKGVGSGEIRVDVGPAAKVDERFRDVPVRTSTQINYAVENKSLIKYRIIEQEKLNHTQYPLFDIYNIDGSPAYRASPIWQFDESSEYPINKNVNRRIIVDGSNFTFSQTLIDYDNGPIYAYKSYTNPNDESPTLHTIWRKGLYDEKYVPQLIDGDGIPSETGDWELPKPVTHNLKHENRKHLTSVDIKHHFKSIIESQHNPAGFVGDDKNRWRIIDKPNYGLGGMIHEYNNGYDTFISSTVVNDVTVIRLLDFVRDRYENQLNIIEDSFQTKIADMLVNKSAEAIKDFQQFVNDTIISSFERNSRRDLVFGDSNTYDPLTRKGVRGWVATAPFVKLAKPSQPKLYIDKSIGLVEIHHHDGHISTPTFNNTRLSDMRSSILAHKMTLKGLSTDRPDINDLSVGTVYYSTDTDTFHKLLLSKRSLVEPTDLVEGSFWYDIKNDSLKQLVNGTYVVVDEADAWLELDLNTIHANVVLEIEQRLYDASPNTDLLFDIDQIKQDPEFQETEKKYFVAFTKDFNIVNPYMGDHNQANSFTWNYSTLLLTDVNVTSTPTHWSNGVPARWYDLYHDIYGTRYPHLEPWVLQKFDSKPSWWDAEYEGTGRPWSFVMWQNIMSGKVPVGHEYPNGVVSQGTSSDGIDNGELPEYTVIPVNITDDVVSGGYKPDQLLPPHYTSSDPNDADAVAYGQLVGTPPASVNASGSYPFGTNGPVEDTWRRSSTYICDLIKMNFIKQPIKFIHNTFGNDFVTVDGLNIDVKLGKVFSHKDTTFHGELENGVPIQVAGINQWYVNYLRFHNYDLQTSDFKSMWTDWNLQLGYQTASFLEQKSVNLSTDSHVLDEADYQIITKRTPGLFDSVIDSLKMVVNKVGTYKLIGGLRVPDGNGSDWKFRITTPNPNVNDVKLYGINVNVVKGSFKALGGSSTSQTWNHYEVDRSNVLTFSPSDIVEVLGSEYVGVQGLVNFIDGYVEYLKDIGFEFTASNLAIRDPDTGRNINWQLETEKMIDQIYRGMASDQLPTEFFGLWNYAFADISTNKFTITGDKGVMLRNNNEVQFSTTGNLPAPFTRDGIYYITNLDIPNKTFQVTNVVGGEPIEIQTMGQGVHSIGMNRFDVPSPSTLYEINPFRNQAVINHEFGIISNIHTGSFKDVHDNQGVYDQYGRPIKPHYINVFRSDKQTKITVDPNIQNDVIVSDPIDPEGRNLLHIGGIHAFVDGYEHAILINSKTIESNTLFDGFLGTSIRKLNTRFRCQEVTNFRPNIGGYIVDDNKLRMNFEGAAEQIQQLYDTHLANEDSDVIEAARNLIGFERKDYFDDMGITSKSQMLFHRGVIQHKGSINAIKAYVNSKNFIDATVDEFWAYKVAEYGDNRKHVYPEIVLNSTDTLTDKLMLQFLDSGEQVEKNFIGISLDDSTRWVDLPTQQREVFGNEPNLYFETDIIDVGSFDGQGIMLHPIDLGGYYDAVKVIADQPEESGKMVVDVLDETGSFNFNISLPVIPYTDSVRVNIERDGISIPNQQVAVDDSGSTVTVSTFRNSSGEYEPLQIGDIVRYNVVNAVLEENVHYRRINARFISFDQTLELFDAVGVKEYRVYGFLPATGNLNPVKLIDYKSNTTLKDIPVWDPARDHHYHIANNIVKFHTDVDPAYYTHSVDNYNIDRNKLHHAVKVGDVWWDRSTTDYVPYYDSIVYPNVNDRASMWGRLTDYASVDLYEWVKSAVHPDQYEEYNKTLSEFVSGTPRKKLFKRDRVSGIFSDNWELLTDNILEIWGYDVINHTVDITNNFDLGDTVNVYINGIYHDNIVVQAQNNISCSESDRIVFIKPKHKPSKDELEFDPEVKDDLSITTQYRYMTDYVQQDRIDPDSGEMIPTYYFWVKHSSTNHKFITLKQAEQMLTKIPTPFVLFQNLLASRRIEIDGKIIILPDRYNQAILRGMDNSINIDNRYKLKFTKKFTLRDDYTDATPNLRSSHTEWQMIREKQNYNIPYVLWTKLTEAISGKTVGEKPVPVPSLDRVIYDEEFDTTTRFGLREGQTFVQQDIGIKVVIESIKDPSHDLYPIDRDEFLNTYSFDTPDNIQEAMNVIYNTFLPEHVNRIWFAALYEGMANNIKYSDIFKTSWIQLDGVRSLDTSGVLK